MSGMTYLRDEENHLKAVQIDAELFGFDEVARRILAKSAEAGVDKCA